MTSETRPVDDDDVCTVARLTEAFARLKAELAKVIVGQEAVIDDLVISIFVRGHCLLIGVPGLAKTLLIQTLSDALNLSFNRVQFTPDLMPSDITGTEVIQEDKTTGVRQFKFLRGPIVRGEAHTPHRLDQQGRVQQVGGRPGPTSRAAEIGMRWETAALLISLPGPERSDLGRRWSLVASAADIRGLLRLGCVDRHQLSRWRSPGAPATGSSVMRNPQNDPDAEIRWWVRIADCSAQVLAVTKVSPAPTLRRFKSELFGG